MSEAKFFIGLIVAAVIAIGVSLFWQDYITAKRDAELASTRKETAENTVDTIDDGAAAREVAAAIASALQTNRTTFTENQTKAKADDPEIADRATRVVKQRVRDNFKERRLARERLGCIPEQCAGSDAADPATKR